MNRLLITICGRAGSKGFKNKNLKVFCGKPLVYYSLSAAELCGCGLMFAAIVASQLPEKKRDRT